MQLRGWNEFSTTKQIFSTHWLGTFNSNIQMLEYGLNGVLQARSSQVQRTMSTSTSGLNGAEPLPQLKPDAFRGDWGDESFNLRRHSAQDVSRYDFISDIARIETVVDAEDCDSGVVVLLTNDHLYWDPATRDDVVDYEFRLTEGKVLEGKLSWGEDVGDGTVGKKRDHPIILDGRYELRWRDYEYRIPSNLEGSDEFRYLVVEVE